MKIQFITAGDSNFAMNPQTEKRGGRRVLKMAQRGCTHFLIFTSPLNIVVDLKDEELLKKLEEMGDTLLSAVDTPLPQQEMIQVSCVDYMNFRRDNEFIVFRDNAAYYAICGCFLSKNDDTLSLLLPRDGMGYRTEIAVEIRYTMKPHVIETRKLLRKEVTRTPFYEVHFEKKTNYIDGSVVYTIGQQPYRYPITEAMLGKTILIRTDNEIPRFESAMPGVTLRNE